RHAGDRPRAGRQQKAQRAGGNVGEWRRDDALALDHVLRDLDGARIAHTKRAGTRRQPRKTIAVRRLVLERHRCFRRDDERFGDHPLLWRAGGVQIEDELGWTFDLVAKLDRIADPHPLPQTFRAGALQLSLFHLRSPYVGGRSQYGLKPHGVEVSAFTAESAGSISSSATGRSTSASTSTLQPGSSLMPCVA